MERVDELIAALERGERPDFTVTQEMEPVTFSTMGGPEPDPKWRYTDANGHEHHRAGEWPTLLWVVDRVYWCPDCCDEHEEGHYECRVCGEVIEPGMVNRGPRTETVPGPTTTLLDDVPISPEDAQRIFAAYNA